MNGPTIRGEHYHYSEINTGTNRISTEQERTIVCTRFYMEMDPELRPILEAASRTSLTSSMTDKLGKPLKTSGEIRPTDMVPAIAPSKDGNRAVFPMVWGYNIPGLNRPVVNCRIETAREKDVWKEGWKSHRCIIPASWYYEWEHIPTASGKMKAGDKYQIQPKGLTELYLAGLYRIEEFRGLKYPVFSILTREPSKELRRLHDRMPVILPAEKIADWIRPSEVAKMALTDMVFEKAG